MSRIISIIGPTASGKSAVALEVAKRIDGEIVSCDSMQIYRGLNVGTAKPSNDETSLIPHHLIDIKEPQEKYSVSDYCRDARAAIDDILSRGKIAVICGGTGLYYSSLVKGIDFAEDSGESEELRNELLLQYEADGIDKFIEELKDADPEHFDKVETSNVKRVLRSVELLRRTGLTVAQQTELSLVNAKPMEVSSYLLSYEDRGILYDRIERRIDMMVKEGILDEAKNVWLNRNTFTTAAAAIGYKEFFPYFDGTASIEECIVALKTATRHYAKRQITWFKREESEKIVMDNQSTLDISDYIVRKEGTDE